MSRKIAASCLAVAAALCGVLAFEMRAAAQPGGGPIGGPTATIVMDSQCWTGDCKNINWTGSTANDQNGNPIPAGSTCTLLLNQTVWICAIAPTFSCNSTGYLATCHGRYIDPNGNVLDCWYWSNNC